MAWFSLALALHQGSVHGIYVSGDGPGTAQRLPQLGVPPERIAGDNCARITQPPTGQRSC